MVQGEERGRLLKRFSNLPPSFCLYFRKSIRKKYK